MSYGDCVNIYITYICDQRKYTKKKRQRRHPFLKKCSVPFLVAQRFDPLEANYIFALLWSIFISSVVDCWPNYLKCASRFKPPLMYSLLTGFRSTVQTQLHLLGLASIYSLKNVKGLTGGSTMYWLVAPKYQRSVCYAWREPASMQWALAHDCRSGHRKTWDSRRHVYHFQHVSAT